MIKKTKRFNFTLLELMVCIVLIGLLAGLAGVKGIDLLAHHRFYSGLQTWLADIQRFRIVAMNQGADVICSLQKNQDGGYQAVWSSESPSIPRLIYTLGEVSALSLDGKPLKECQVTLYSSGRLTPVGTLKIEPKRSKEPPVFLDLAYPIAFQTTPPSRAQSFFLPPYPQKQKS